MGPKQDISKEDVLESFTLELEDLATDIRLTKEMGEASDVTSAKMFKARMTRLDATWDKFSNVVGKAREVASALKNEDALRNLVGLTKITRDHYYKAISLDLEQNSPADTSQHNNSLLGGSAGISPKLSLPPMSIPTFSGDIAAWASFKDTFTTLIHDNPDVKPIQKFYYLRGALKGLALNAIADIPTTVANYPQAWSSLVNKYDNKRILAATYLTTIFNHKPFAKGNLTSLEKFSNTVLESAHAFKRIEFDDPVGFILVTWMLRLLDPITREKFEYEHADKKEGPTYDDLTKFIHKQCTILQSGMLTSSSVSAKNDIITKRATFVSTTYDRNDLCPLCKRKHRLFNCPVFKGLSPSLRYEKVKTFHCCTNCLSPNHLNFKCTSAQVCRHCKQKHHSFLHFPTAKSKSSTPNLDQPKDQSSKLEANKRPEKSDTSEQCTSASYYISENDRKEGSPKASVLANIAKESPLVILGTALARIKDASGSYQVVRLLVDCASQRSIITAACAKRLGLRYKRNNQRLYGLAGCSIDDGKYQVHCCLTPYKQDQPLLRTDAVVVQQISPLMPPTQLPSNIIQNYDKCELADPEFGKPSKIDFLLGADLYSEILRPNPTPVCHCTSSVHTVFGCVIIGKMCPENSRDSHSNPNEQYSSVLFTTSSTLDDCLQKFWEVENVNIPLVVDPQEIKAETYFTETHTRTTDGRYIVRLPFKDPNKVNLSSSYPTALHRFQKLENRINKTPSLKCEYNKQMKGYIEKGYMSLALKTGAYFLPHHGVSKEGDPPKLRIVFDASMPTATGSLNDYLLTGPKLHLEIKDVILNFRRYRIAVTADISEMFLRIWVHSTDRKYQHILYRFEPTEAIKEYELNTLTFGQASSPYLALRVLRQLVSDEGENFPKAKRALLHETYVDDILTGADNTDEAQELQSELDALLNKGGFALKKWASNSTEVLQRISPDIRGTSISFSDMDSTAIKILGMIWDPVTDHFSYQIQLPEICYTKRSVLSVIARLYDPLGYLAPVIFKAKTFLQELWSLKLGWDDTIPDALKKRWGEFLPRLAELSALRIQRCLISFQPSHASLMGFADASMLGYAASLYVRLADDSGNVTTNLIFAKTKLAPLKTMTIPRLELCAALLLIRMLKSTQQFIQDMNIKEIILCSDSTVVLNWLSIAPHTLKVFVANGVVAILKGSTLNNWYHVPSTSNPADIASRGVNPSELLEKSLWWHGPEWLREKPDSWPITQHYSMSASLPETKAQVVLLTRSATESILIEWISKFSTLTKVRQTMACLHRLIHKIKTGTHLAKGPLLLSEINRAMEDLIIITQRYYFNDIVKTLKNSGEVSKELQALSPFLDSRDILRVGGRLTNSPLAYDAKHPVLLPPKSHLAKLIVDYMHEGYLHAGPQLLHALIQRRYWIISARRLIRSRVHQCLTCHKLRTKNITPYMSDLPQSRFEQGRAFIIAGVDFAGPFLVRDSLRRKYTTSKAYVCLLICLSTKAVHLELVSQMSTDAFLGCFDRFIARRGLPSAMWSDHGTNFVGADHQLRELWCWVNSNQIQNALTKHLNKRQINWKFNPPAAPHFGGLWEAGVKSFKGHMIRTIGHQISTFEELSTVIARIEAILNSRPLYPLSSSPHEYDVLTPGHFLIGAPLVEAPHPDFSSTPVNRLSRWQLLQRSIQDFWKRWRLEYLNSLQQRCKWRRAINNLEPGSLVLLRDPSCTPLQWPTGRVLETYPGKDGVVRVVKIRTLSGEYVRPVTMLSPLLPVPEKETENHPNSQVEDL